MESEELQYLSDGRVAYDFEERLIPASAALERASIASSWMHIGFDYALRRYVLPLVASDRDVGVSVDFYGERERD